MSYVAGGTSFRQPLPFPPLRRQFLPLIPLPIHIHIALRHRNLPRRSHHLSRRRMYIDVMLRVRVLLVVMLVMTIHLEGERWDVDVE